MEKTPRFVVVELFDDSEFDAPFVAGNIVAKFGDRVKLAYAAIDDGFAGSGGSSAPAPRSRARARPAMAKTAAVDPADLMGLKEIAEHLGVPSASARQWSKRGLLPDPVARLACGPIWTRPQIVKWASERYVEETRTLRRS